MSSENWSILVDLYKQGPPKGVDRKAWKLIPSVQEPWVSYAIVAELAQMGAEAVRKKASRLAPKYRHPSFTGLIRV